MDSLKWLSATSRRVAHRVATWFAHLWMRPARGQGLVEYALILVLVAIVVIGVLSTLGGKTSQVFDQVNCTLDGGTLHQDNGNGNSTRCR